MGLKPTGQRLAQRRELRPQPPARELREHVRVGRPPDQGLRHRPTREAHRSVAAAWRSVPITSLLGVLKATMRRAGGSRVKFWADSRYRSCTDVARRERPPMIANFHDARVDHGP